jgi:hypothetical protein
VILLKITSFFCFKKRKMKKILKNVPSNAREKQTSEKDEKI